MKKNVKRNMKKKPLIIIIALVLLLLPSSASLADSYVLKTSDYTFTNESDPISMPSYLINGEVYVPLHIFADTFDVTVSYDAATENINMDFGQDEGKQARLAALTQYVKNTARTVGPSPHTILVQGKEIEMPMLLVDGHNFMQIDVIAEGFGLRAVHDASANKIALTQDELFGSPYLPKYEEYLKNNHIAVDTGSMKALEGVDFDPYHIYLVGEQHAIARDFDIQLYFIKYLNEHQNVRYIISEDGFCGTMLLNRYLQTGDTSIIKSTVEGTKGSLAYSKNYYEFYEKLYEYNKTLPQDRKLTFIGIDVQHNPQVGFDYLLSLPDKTKQTPDSVKSLLTLMEGRAEADVSQMMTLLEQNEKDFRDYFGDQYDSFRFGLRSVDQGIKFYGEDDFAVREKFIHENFKDYYEAYDMKKCFGMFGGAHTLLNGSFDDISNLAGYMNVEYGPTRGKVCSIMTNYINCYYMDQETGKSVPVTYTQSESVSRLLDRYAKTDLELFPLDREGSPFAESGFTGAFQYYLCVKNSPAATPYGPLGDHQ